MFTDGFIYGIVAPVIPFVLQDQKLVHEDKRTSHTHSLDFILTIKVQLSTSLLIAAFSIADFFGARTSLDPQTLLIAHNDSTLCVVRRPF